MITCTYKQKSRKKRSLWNNLPPLALDSWIWTKTLRKLSLSFLVDGDENFWREHLPSIKEAGLLIKQDITLSKRTKLKLRASPAMRRALQQKISNGNSLSLLSMTTTKPWLVRIQHQLYKFRDPDNLKVISRSLLKLSTPTTSNVNHCSDNCSCMIRSYISCWRTHAERTPKFPKNWLNEWNNLKKTHCTNYCNY